MTLNFDLTGVREANSKVYSNTPEDVFEVSGFEMVKEDALVSGSLSV